MSRRSLALSLCIAFLGGCAIQSGESADAPGASKGVSELSTNVSTSDNSPTEGSSASKPDPLEEIATESAPDKPSPDPWRAARINGQPVDPGVNSSNSLSKTGK
jgi:hypothetical protein